MKLFAEKQAAEYLEGLRTSKPKIDQLWKAVGGLSEPSKMPWFSYSLPAEKCRMGSHYRLQTGTVCSKCYARKGKYVFPNVQHAMFNRFNILDGNITEWAAHMVALLERKANGNQYYFRWHDSGDLQGLQHLRAIVWIAKMLPHVQFFLPTKEAVLVEQEFYHIWSAPNLTVRVSAPMIGQVIKLLHHQTSSVGVEKTHLGEVLDIFQCPAHEQGNVCGECRACWDRGVEVVNYKEH